MSTAVPRFPLRPCRPDMNSAESLKRYAKFLQPRWFHSVPVQPGDMLIFPQTLPHYGTAAPANVSSPRQVLFTMFATEIEDEQGQHQLFRWRYMLEAYGDMSRQYCRALLADVRRRGIDMSKGEDVHKQLRVDYKCLKKHGKLRQYCRQLPRKQLLHFLKFAKPSAPERHLLLQRPRIRHHSIMQRKQRMTLRPRQ